MCGGDVCKMTFYFVKNNYFFSVAVLIVLYINWVAATAAVYLGIITKSFVKRHA